jgi:hypothetical protein
MKTVRFKRPGWHYLSISVPGAVITLAAMAFCLQVFLAVNRKSHSVSDTLYGVFPYFACGSCCSIGLPTEPAVKPAGKSNFKIR